MAPSATLDRTDQRPPTLPSYDVPPPPPTPGRRGAPRPRPGRAIVGLMLVAALASGAGGVLVARDLEQSSTSTSVSAASTTVATATSAGSLSGVIARAQRSVVSLVVRGGSTSDEGSGVVISASGLIVTDNHVVAAAADGGTIRVTFADGRSAAATIVGRDASTDVAVVTVSGVGGLVPATLGTSSSLAVGDTVLAIGSPLGLTGSVSEGIVSALHRTVTASDADGTGTETLHQVIQTDAAINPGNSGGPLIDVAGRVVGLAVANASLDGSGGSTGVGFAMSIDQVRAVVAQLVG